MHFIAVIGFKVKQIEREKAANTKKRMLLKEADHLQSVLRIRISTYICTIQNDFLARVIFGKFACGKLIGEQLCVAQIETK